MLNSTLCHGLEEEDENVEWLLQGSQEGAEVSFGLYRPDLKDNPANSTLGLLSFLGDSKVF